MLKAIVAVQDQIVGLKGRLTSDESGASLVEYSVLIGLITVATVATIALVGAWVSGKWDALNTALAG